MKRDPETRPGRPRSEAARRAVLRAALRLLKKSGVSGVTAEAVAASSGVSKATLYRWWPCGPAIAMDAFFDDFATQVAAVDTGSLLEDLRARGRQAGRLLSGRLGDVLAGLIAATHDDPRLAQTFHDRFLVPSRRNVRRLVDRAIASGDLCAGIDPEVAVDVICGPFFYRRVVLNQETSPELMDEILSCVLDGLRPRERLARRARRRAHAPA